MHQAVQEHEADDRREARSGCGERARRQGYASRRGRGRQLRLRRRLRRRVPRLPLQLQRGRLRAARHGSRRQARPPRRERARRRRDGRPGRARRAGRHRGAPHVARPLSRSPLGGHLPRRGRVARLLAEEARLPRRLARPSREGRASSRSASTRTTAEFSYHDPHGGRALLELLPTPSWHDVQYRR